MINLKTFEELKLKSVYLPISVILFISFKHVSGQITKSYRFITNHSYFVHVSPCPCYCDAFLFSLLFIVSYDLKLFFILLIYSQGHNGGGLCFGYGMAQPYASKNCAI